MSVGSYNTRKWKQSVKNMKHLLQSMIADDSGQDLVEYVLITAVVALGSLLAMRQLSNLLGNTFNNIANAVGTT
jgi:pilus assembly protein Flp/PilA